MAFDSRVKGGLAWLGLVVVLAVPAADLVLGKGGAQLVPAVPAPALTPPKAPVALADDPVARRLASGKGLPSYISDREPGEEATAAATKPPATPALPSPARPAALASVPAAEVTPPLPLPRTARPKGTLVADTAPADEEPLILDEAAVGAYEEAGIEPFPLSDAGSRDGTQRPDEWDTESLADYLARQGLIAEDEGDGAESYDPDGFYLDEGPNTTRQRKVQSLEWFLF